MVHLVETICYKPEGHGKNSWWSHWYFPWLYPSGRTLALGSTHTLTEMSIGVISWRGGVVAGA